MTLQPKSRIRLTLLTSTLIVGIVALVFLYIKPFVMYNSDAHQIYNIHVYDPLGDVVCDTNMYFYNGHTITFYCDGVRHEATPDYDTVVKIRTLDLDRLPQ